MSWQECAFAPRCSNCRRGLSGRWPPLAAKRQTLRFRSCCPCAPPVCQTSACHRNEAGTGNERDARQQEPSRYPGHQICQVRCSPRPAVGTGPREHSEPETPGQAGREQAIPSRHRRRACQPPGCQAEARRTQRSSRTAHGQTAVSRLRCLICLMEQEHRGLGPGLGRNSRTPDCWPSPNPARGWRACPQAETATRPGRQGWCPGAGERANRGRSAWTV